MIYRCGMVDSSPPILQYNQSTVAHWYAICYVPGGPGLKSPQGRELLILDKKEFNHLNLNRPQKVVRKDVSSPEGTKFI